MTHLWEAPHDYYGPEGSYWANGPDQSPYNQHHESWAAFASDDEDTMYSALMGLNMIYRWDWHDYRADRAAYSADEDGSYTSRDEDYPSDFELELFWMMPRKGIMARSTIIVTEDDEPDVTEFLMKHADYMARLWAPLNMGQERTDRGTDG